MLAIGQSPRDPVILRPNVKYVGNMHGNEVSCDCAVICLLYEQGFGSGPQGAGEGGGCGGMFKTSLRRRKIRQKTH